MGGKSNLTGCTYSDLKYTVAVLDEAWALDSNNLLHEGAIQAKLTEGKRKLAQALTNLVVTQ